MISRFRSGMVVVLLLTCCCNACYNFKGISIPPDLNTFYVETFVLVDETSPADLHQLFAERLREKIREESKLVNDNNEPDIVFSGAINDFRIDEVAPTEDNTISLNRLKIIVKVNYSDEKNPDNNWSRNYDAFEDFDATSDLQAIQEGIIENLIEDMVERIFNDSFTNW